MNHLNLNAPSPLDVTKAWIHTTFKHQRQLYCCRFSPDGRHVFAGTQDGQILRWSLVSPPEPPKPEAKAKADKEAKKPPEPAATVLEGHPAWVSRLVFTPDLSLIHI